MTTIVDIRRQKVKFTAADRDKVYQLRSTENVRVWYALYTHTHTHTHTHIYIYIYICTHEWALISP